MKRKLIFVAVLIMASVAKGQVAKWLIPPMYDGIHMPEGADLIITDSIKEKIIWTAEGKRLASTSEQLFPFRDDAALVIKHESAEISGIYDIEGHFTPVTGLSVAHSWPYFSSGSLLVKEGYYYRFMDRKGNLMDGKYVKANPFFNGYASCTTYRNLEKQKDPYNLLLTKNHEEVAFSYNDKKIDPDDIEFISSVNSEHIGIVVAKHKVYFFQGKDQRLSPVYASKGETESGIQAKLDKNISQSLIEESDSVYLLEARCGKKDTVRIRFNAMFVPTSIKYMDGEYYYKSQAPMTRPMDSPLKMTEENELYGIYCEDKEVLPPQLDEVVACFGEKAFVKLLGKYGMLKVLKDETFRLSINKGNDIAFRHQKYETVIRLDLPAAISASDAKIEVCPGLGCDVDMPSGEKKDTEFGNYVQYDCILNIPDSLPDEMFGDERNEITYPTQVLYSGLKSPVIPFKVKAWHYKYFNVDVNEAETVISQGALSFTFNINAERNPGEAVYPTSVNIQTDSLQVELEKISETRYKCKVLALNEGKNNIVVQILEQGCPPASFPFEVMYTKPAAKTKNKAAVKEEVVITKKARTTQVSDTPSRPHLDV